MKKEAFLVLIYSVACYSPFPSGVKVCAALASDEVLTTCTASAECPLGAVVVMICTPSGVCTLCA